MQAETSFKYVYGPVHSWRLGMSLGIDPLSDKSKICNMDCVYCQLGKTVYWSNQRQEFVPTQDVITEIEALPPVNVDHITFSGRGEPTLAANLGDMINAVRQIRQEKIAVITNSVLMDDPSVRADLSLADFVLAKLDACDQEMFQSVDRVMHDICFVNVVEGIRQFRKDFKGRFALQVMFVKANQGSAIRIAEIANSIGADEIEINTPLRPSAVMPLCEEELLEIKEYFPGQNVKTVYENERRMVEPINERETMIRHGNYKKQK